MTAIGRGVQERRGKTVRRVLKYLELKSGYADNGPAWIAKVSVSKSGRTIYFNGKALKRGHGVGANHFDLETGEEWWVSGVKKDGLDRHWAGAGKVAIETGVIEEYLRVIGATELDRSTFEIVEDLETVDPAMFYDRENERL